MAAPLSTLRDLLELHRAQLFGVIEIRGVGRLRKIYGEARADMQGRLDDLVRRGRGQTFTAFHYRQVLAQINQALATFSARFRQHLDKTGEFAGILGNTHVVREYKTLERRFTGASPVIQAEQVGVVRRIYSQVAPSLLTRFQQSMTLYGRPTVEAIHRQLAHSLTTGDTLDQAVDRVAATDGVFAGQRWRAERIARTELSFSYGATKHRTMQEMAVAEPTLMKRLIETSDNREGEDSKRLHGQVRRVDEPFVYDPPPGKKGYPPFLMPPGRPNDRAVAILWRQGWPESSLFERDGAPGVTPRVPAEP